MKMFDLIYPKRERERDSTCRITADSQTLNDMIVDTSLDFYNI